jgi:hypothetical protein
MNPVHILLSCFFKFHFNIIYHIHITLPRGHCPSVFPNKTVYAYPINTYKIRYTSVSLYKARQRKETSFRVLNEQTASMFFETSIHLMCPAELCSAVVTVPNLRSLHSNYLSSVTIIFTTTVRLSGFHSPINVQVMSTHYQTPYKEKSTL